MFAGEKSLKREKGKFNIFIPYSVSFTVSITIQIFSSSHEILRRKHFFFKMDYLWLVNFTSNVLKHLPFCNSSEDIYLLPSLFRRLYNIKHLGVRLKTNHCFDKFMYTLNFPVYIPP